jgi:uncharacterized protein (DUF2384 family)
MAAVMDRVPVFERNFEGFLDYVRGSENDPVAISPKKFGQALRVDMQTLAERAHVHRNTLSQRPETESVQKYFRENIKVLMAAKDVNDNVENAIFWFKNHPIPAFDYKTAEELVSEGRSEDLIRYIKSLQAGFAG